MRLAHICPHCRTIVRARQSCPKCGAGSVKARRQTPTYRRNRLVRFEMAGGRCESCGEALLPKRWECHHVGPTDEPHDLRVLCAWIENGKRKGCHVKTYKER